MPTRKWVRQVGMLVALVAGMQVLLAVMLVVLAVLLVAVQAGMPD